MRFNILTKIQIYLTSLFSTFNMKRVFSIIFFLTVWLTCQSQNFSLVSPSFQDEPLVMLDNQGEFLFEQPYQSTQSQFLSFDRIKHYNNEIEISLGGSYVMCLSLTEDCEWIGKYDLYQDRIWVEGFVFIIAEDVIMYDK